MIKRQPKVSVVIPVCNDEEYLTQCIESVVNQTMMNIEIICVEDASDDGSYELLMELVQKYSERKFKIIRHKKRMSAFQCRKDGVLASEGEYVTFLDSDDFYELDTCQVAYDAIVKNRTDVLQYGGVVENCANIPAWRIELNQKGLIPKTEEVLTGNLQRACYIEHKIQASINFKIYRGDICRKAFEQLEDGVIHYAEDLYALFVVLFYAKSFVAVDKRLYHYCFGRGLVGTDEISLERFKTYCQGAWVVQALYRLLDELNENERLECEDIVKRIEKDLFMENSQKWFDYLELGEKHAGLDYMCKVWKVDFSTILATLVSRLYYRRAEVADVLRGYSLLQYHPRKIKNIVFYYRNIFNGGAQRVVAELCNMFAVKFKKSCNIILVTDENPSEGEYELLSNVRRVVIPSCGSSREWRYSERMQAWLDIIDKYQVDVVFNSMWMDPVTFWDMLTIKSHPTHPAFVNHCHSFFATIYQWEGFKVFQFRKEYSLADAVVTLSSCDKRFWETVNPYTYMIPNPCQFKVSKNKGSFRNKEILWVGRISWEKRPLEIPKIMEKVLVSMPEAICRVVGSGDKGLMDSLQREIKARGLEAHVIIEGFHKDIRSFYEKASILLTTSSFEGFPLTLFEAAAFGLPTVTYDLPWLEYYKMMEGWSSVPQLDANAAASAIIELLENEELWQEKSDAIYRSFIKYKKSAVMPGWQMLLKDLEEERGRKQIADKELSLMFDQISNFHQIALNSINKGSQAVRKRFDFHFPWKMVVPGSKLIIYGGGDMGKQYRDLLEMTNYCEIVAFCDRNPSGTGITNKKVLSIEELAAMSSDKYDAIIIAIADGKIAKSVRESLEQSGINWGKIIWQVMRT